MVDPSIRQALRRGLPWTFLGFVLLVASIVAWTAWFLVEQPLFAEDAADLLGLGARVLGLLGTVLFALGLSSFVRSCREGPGRRWLDLALVLWVAELGLRIAFLVAPEHLASFAAGLRLALIAGAMAALASWMAAVWREDPSRVRSSWSATRIVFLLQLAGVVLLASVPGVLEKLVPADLGLTVSWVAFAAPWLVLYVALRRTMRELTRQQTVADVLTG